MFIGDKSRHINAGLDEAEMERYQCTCGFEKDVAVEYDLLQGMFFPVSFTDTICEKCGEAMDRKHEPSVTCSICARRLNVDGECFNVNHRKR